jgi:hypothetical protein
MLMREFKNLVASFPTEHDDLEIWICDDSESTAWLFDKENLQVDEIITDFLQKDPSKKEVVCIS